MPAWQDSEAAFDRNEVVQAVKLRLADGGAPIVEVMIPLVSDAAELALVRRWMGDEVRVSTPVRWPSSRAKPLICLSKAGIASRMASIA